MSDFAYDVWRLLGQGSHGSRHQVPSADVRRGHAVWARGREAGASRGNLKNRNPDETMKRGKFVVSQLDWLRDANRAQYASRGRRGARGGAEARWRHRGPEVGRGWNEFLIRDALRTPLSPRLQKRISSWQERSSIRASMIAERTEPVMIALLSRRRTSF